MTNFAYAKLVLLTESPGARIGRIPTQALSANEQRVLRLLTLQRLFERRWDWPREKFSQALLALSPESWLQTLQDLRVIGLARQAKHIKCAMGILGARPDQPETWKPSMLDQASERRWRRAERLIVNLPYDDIHEALAEFVECHAPSIPGAEWMHQLETRQ